MADERERRHEPAHGRLRPGRAARGRGDDDEGPLPVAHVALYVADGCALCADALASVQALRQEVAFELTVVRIDGDDELERRYRALLPVIEVDGRQELVFEVDPVRLRELLGS